MFWFWTFLSSSAPTGHSRRYLLWFRFLQTPSEPDPDQILSDLQFTVEWPIQDSHFLFLCQIGRTPIFLLNTLVRNFPPESDSFQGKKGPNFHTETSCLRFINITSSFIQQLHWLFFIICSFSVLFVVLLYVLMLVSFGLYFNRRWK